MSHDLERLRHLAASGDPFALDALEREARRRGDISTERVARARRASSASPSAAEVSWEVLQDRLSALSDPDPDIRALAVEEIAALPLAAAAMWPPLQDALRDPSPEVRTAAAFAVTWLDDPSINAPLQDALAACLTDPDPQTRDQAAASLTTRFAQIDAYSARQTWRSLHSIFFNAYYKAYPPNPPPSSPHAEDLDLYAHMDVFPIEVQPAGPPPPPDPPPNPDIPLGWACLITDALSPQNYFRWMSDTERATIARLAPLTSLALLVESHIARWYREREWSEFSGFAFHNHTDQPSPVLTARLQILLASEHDAERAAAAMAWSEILSACTGDQGLNFSHLASAGAAWSDIMSASAPKPIPRPPHFRALSTHFQNHPDPTVRRYALPGRLLCADCSSTKFSIMESALHDPDPDVRAFAAALLCDNWPGPWSEPQAVAQYPSNGALERIQIPHIFSIIWFTNPLDASVLLGLASFASHDPSREVRLHALILFAKLFRTTHAPLRTITRNALSAAHSNDPDLGLRAIAQWLLDWL